MTLDAVAVWRRKRPTAYPASSSTRSAKLAGEPWIFTRMVSD